MESNHNYQFRKLVYYPLYDGDIFGRGDEIRTHDDDFKDRCLRPLGDTPTEKRKLPGDAMRTSLGAILWSG